ncbi:hypothetical protein MLPF_3382 [Mycobacterium lepromatosis]|nr:hypothetical protein MLPF_3382 [Mycobacterium lepromatosis]
MALRRYRTHVWLVYGATLVSRLSSCSRVRLLIGWVTTAELRPAILCGLRRSPGLIFEFSRNNDHGWQSSGFMGEPHR